MLAGLRKLLEPELEVVATATDGRELLAAAMTLRPDLVITDVETSGLDGISSAVGQGTGLDACPLPRRPVCASI